MKMKNVQLDYGDIVVHVTETTISVMSSQMSLAEKNMPVHIADSDFVWEISLSEAIDKSTTELYSDFVVTTEYAMTMNDFATMMQRARVSRTVLTPLSY